MFRLHQLTTRPVRLYLALSVALLTPLTLRAFGGFAPDSNFDLHYWELAIPTGPTGDPTIIPSSSLTSGYSNGQYFFTNSSDGSMAMKQPGSSCTKFSGSKFCRTEFHEVSTSSGAETSWSPSGTNKLNGTLYVTEIGSGTVISQVFLDDSDHKPLGELEYQSTGKLYLNVEQSQAGGDAKPYYIGTAAVGSKFSYELNYSNNKLTASLNGNETTIPVPGSLQGIKAFFKAGNYGQSSDPTDVHFTKLTITH
jgi:hypothetical protein